MGQQPPPDRLGLVGAVVVHDQVHVQAGRDLPVELGEKLLELRGAVSAVERADHLAARGIQRGEQGGGARAQGVVAAAFGHPGHHREHRLGPVQRLDLRLLIHAQHQRPLRRVEIQTHHVVHLVHKERVGGRLERLGAVRLETEGPPDPRHRRLRHAGPPGHRPGRPVSGVLRPCLQRQAHQFGNLLVGDGPHPPRPGRITQPVQPVGDEPGPPLGDRLGGDPELPGHRTGRPRQPVRLHLGTAHHDPRPQRQDLGRGLSPHPLTQHLTLMLGQHQLSPTAAPDAPCISNDASMTQVTRSLPATPASGPATSSGQWPRRAEPTRRTPPGR
ncbi:hypothetical protein QFZ67_000334 [Streptomyces sp. V1I1]|nr:hypothetical protein [Streptomyces sp. V1I1]